MTAPAEINIESEALVSRLRLIADLSESGGPLGRKPWINPWPIIHELFSRNLEPEQQREVFVAWLEIVEGSLQSLEVLGPMDEWLDDESNRRWAAGEAKQRGFLLCRLAVHWGLQPLELLCGFTPFPTTSVSATPVSMPWWQRLRRAICRS